ncbi:lipase secretion chaperone [Pseudomonas aeruginosa]|nr:lipase secretion chaperone [Pseudomonas aeruginosa]
MNKKVFTFLGCCPWAGAGAGVGWWLQGESLVTARPATVERISRAELAPAKVQESSAQALAVAAPTTLPRSLVGTEVNCPVEAGDDGHLRITNGLRQCFDYFLAAIGEESLDVLVARIRAQLGGRLQEPARGEAERILVDYLAYLRGLESIQQGSEVREVGGADLDAIRQRMQQMRALREQYLSTEVIVAFFGEEDAYDRYTLARLELMRDKTLSAQARAQQLAELERQLPEGLQQSLKAVNQYLNLKTLTDKWKQHAGSAEELYQIRMSLVGAEATARLEALDQENIAWDRRMSEWFAQRDELLKTPGLSREDRERQLEELRRGSFSSEAERLRVEALERINDAGQP